MGKHTPGPWKFSQVESHLGVWGANEYRVFSIHKGVVPGNADAALIAAAPDLLEACKLVAFSGAPCECRAESERAVCFHEVVRAAIAKAGGN